jgi:hypothetical protein
MIKLAPFALVVLLASACAQRQVQVLTGPPSVAHRTVGMLSGQGDDEGSALAHVLEQASRLEADAVIVESRRMLGRSVIVTCRAIRWTGPPPGSEPAPGAEPAPPPAP